MNCLHGPHLRAGSISTNRHGKWNQRRHGARLRFWLLCTMRQTRRAPRSCRRARRRVAARPRQSRAKHSPHQRCRGCSGTPEVPLPAPPTAANTRTRVLRGGMALRESEHAATKTFKTVKTIDSPSVRASFRVPSVEGPHGTPVKYKLKRWSRIVVRNRRYLRRRQGPAARERSSSCPQPDSSCASPDPSECTHRVSKLRNDPTAQR